MLLMIYCKDDATEMPVSVLCGGHGQGPPKLVRLVLTLVIKTYSQPVNSFLTSFWSEIRGRGVTHFQDLYSGKGRMMATHWSQTGAVKQPSTPTLTLTGGQNPPRRVLCRNNTLDRLLSYLLKI